MPSRLDRLARALPDGGDVVAVASFTAYNPEVIAGVMAAAMGAASLGTGGQATGMALDQVMSWGSEAKQRLLPLPHRIVVVVRSDDVTLYEWQGRSRLGRRVAHWERGAFTAEIKRRHLAGEVELWIHEGSSLRAILNAKSGQLHHAGDRCAAAVVQRSAAS